MKLVALVALALLPVALGTPASDSTSVTGKLASDAQAASTAKFRVTASALKCRTEPSTTKGVSLRQYPIGTVITATCWTTGTTVEGDSYWDKTTDGCYCSEAYLEYISGYYPHC